MTQASAPQQEQRSSRSRDAALHIFAGGSLGLLTGVLLGLSASELVGNVGGGIVALLAAFFGLGATDQWPIGGRAVASTRRVIAFSLAALLGIAGGLTIRTHDLLAPSPEAAVKTWTGIGVLDDVARDLVVFQRLGLLREGWSAADGATQMAARRAPVLFSRDAASRCDDLSLRALVSTTERLRGFEVAAGDWATVAAAVRESPESVQARVLEATWKLVCED